MLLQNVPNGLLLSYRSWFQPPGRDLSAARWTCRCRGKPPRARRPNFVVRRTSASCNLTVGSWECRQAATGRLATFEFAELACTRLHHFLSRLGDDSLRYL